MNILPGKWKRNTSVHPIGNVIRNLLTKEEARILRVIHPMSLAAEDATESDVIAYVVAVPKGQLAAPHERIWLHSNVEPV